MTCRPTTLFPLSALDVQIYRACEILTGPLIYFELLFSPWAFGTTQSWSIWTMNAAGYCLGILLLAKLAIRWLKGFLPSRWDSSEFSPVEGAQSPNSKFITPSRLTATLAILTFAILTYCLVSAFNAHSTYHRQDLSFVYHQYLKWLPHSFDSGKTWFTFWNYLGLAFSFWALRDWLLGKSSGEERAAHLKKGSPSRVRSLFPSRLRRLLWVLSINGALLGLEGIAQRLEGSGRLLFLIKPVINPEALSQFGPYHYRSNAAQYFNLLWPVSLGFWWTLRRTFGSSRRSYHFLLVCGAIMAACPIISTTRGGALITIGILVLAAFFLLAAHFLFSSANQDKPTRRITSVLLVLFFAGALALGFSLGWKALAPRLAQIGEGFEGREQMYEVAKPMAADYPLFGTGPGTFESVFLLYRISTETYWPAQLHNDWLETRITFGWLGTSLIAAAFLIVLLRWFVPTGIHGGRRFVILLWLALGGCLVHARFDFPFQVYSIVFLFLVLCAVLFDLSRRPS